MLKLLPLSVGVVSAALLLSGCETPFDSAVAGAATGAVLGGALKGTGRDMARGAAIGAAGGMFLENMARRRGRGAIPKLKACMLRLCKGLRILHPRRLFITTNTILGGGGFPGGSSLALRDTCIPPSVIGWWMCAVSPGGPRWLTLTLDAVFLIPDEGFRSWKAMARRTEGAFHG